jgi:hypothetical protein
MNELCEGVNIKYSTAGREHIIGEVINVCLHEDYDMSSCRFMSMSMCWSMKEIMNIM